MKRVGIGVLLLLIVILGVMGGAWWARQGKAVSPGYLVKVALQATPSQGMIVTNLKAKVIRIAVPDQDYNARQDAKSTDKRPPLQRVVMQWQCDLLGNGKTATRLDRVRATFLDTDGFCLAESEHPSESFLLSSGLSSLNTVLSSNGILPVREDVVIDGSIVHSIAACSISIEGREASIDLNLWIEKQKRIEEKMKDVPRMRAMDGTNSDFSLLWLWKNRTDVDNDFLLAEYLLEWDEVDAVIEEAMARMKTNPNDPTVCDAERFLKFRLPTFSGFKPRSK